MSAAMTWRTEQSPTEVAQGRSHLREVALDNRVETLREAALTVLREVESLRSPQINRVDGRISLSEEVQRFEIDLILSALERTRGNQVRAAQLLGVKPTTLNAKLKRYKISFTSYEARENPDLRNREIAA